MVNTRGGGALLVYRTVHWRTLKPANQFRVNPSASANAVRDEKLDTSLRLNLYTILPLPILYEQRGPVGGRIPRISRAMVLQ